MVNWPESDDFDSIADSIVDNLQELNERIETANDHYRAGYGFAGNLFVDTIEGADAQYRELADLMESPLYDHPDKVVEELHRTENNLKKVDCYLSIDFEEADY
jgi:hypothetical protein